jgi:hypothetical protein
MYSLGEEDEYAREEKAPGMKNEPSEKEETPFALSSQV